MAFVFFLVVGFLCIISFHFGIIYPISLSIGLIVVVALFLGWEFKRKRIGLLAWYLWFVYTLPFIHILPYLWFDFSTSPVLLWGLATNPYMIDERVVQLTAMIGAAGSIGLALGGLFSRKGVITKGRLLVHTSQNERICLALPMFLAWTTLGVLLSWLAAPEASIFTAVYTNSAAPLEGKNFSSAWMISYIVLAYVFSDAILEPSLLVRKQKFRISVSAIAYVVLVLQLLRGDRESIPFVVGLILIFYYWAAPITREYRTNVPWIRICFLGFLIVAISMLVGAARSTLVGVEDLDEVLEVLVMLYDSDIIGFSNMIHGTWSAVLLTPLSVAGDHINGYLDLEAGQTYIDLILSLPPGFVADALGYVRPIDGLAGPAWEMRYGIGGTHATVVPFMNFRMAGVVLITALWSFLLFRFEKKAARRSSVSSLSFLCAIVLAAPHWLWYGEKSGMNAIIIWFLLNILYRISIGLDVKLRPPRSLNAQTNI